MKFEACIGFTLREEGPLSLDPKDRGNWLGGVLVGTNWGISAPVLALWLRDQRLPSAPADVATAMRSLSTATAFAIYRRKYWNVLHGDELAAGIDLMVFDHGVNTGCETSARLLQNILGVTPDGIIGAEETLPAVAKRWPSELIAELRTAQEADYRNMRDFSLYGEEWLGRLERRRAAADALNAASVKILTGETS